MKDETFIQEYQSIVEKTIQANEKSTDALKTLLNSYLDPKAEENSIDPVFLSNFMDTEKYPHIYALILAFLDPYKASIMLENLPYKMQSNITHRIATMDVNTSDQIEHIIKSLKTAVHILENIQSAQDSESRILLGGVQCMVDILRQADASSANRIIEDLKTKDSELAEELKRRLSIANDEEIENIISGKE